MTDPLYVAAGASGGLFSAIGMPLARSLGGQWKRVQWEFAETKYRERVRRNLSRTRLLGAAEEVDIESLFTDVSFVPESSASRRFSAAAMSFTDFSDLVDRRKAERFDALEALKRCDRLYILGTPGAGKTTFLKHVAVAAAAGRIPGLPIFIALKDWADSGKDFMAFATHEFNVCGFSDATPVIEALLASGDALLLFDGLDEVNTANGSRGTIVKALVELERKYPDSRILLTCRTSANDHSFSRFKYVEIADFLPPQQTTFVGKWFASDPPRAAQFLERFGDDTSRTLRELGRKPLFLAFLCLAFDQTLDFPRTKSALHAEAVDVLLNKWDASRSIQRDNYGLKGAQRKKQFLAQLAQRSFELDRYAFTETMLASVLAHFLERMPGVDQNAEIDAATLARSLEAAHGILVERAVGLFAFSHLSIHEYFAALGLVNLVASGASWPTLVPHDALYTPRWREVLLHVGSALHDGETFLAFLLQSAQEHIDRSPQTARLLAHVTRVAAEDTLFEQFAVNPVRWLQRHSEYGNSFCEDFYPSTHLSNAITRLERSVLYLLKLHRDNGRPLPASLVALWRRLEVLRETVAFKHGLALVLGMVVDPDGLDEHLAHCVDGQDVLLILLDDILVAQRDKARDRILALAG